MGVMTLIRLWWQRRQRQIDLDILWPTCVNACNGDLACAKRAFKWHIYSDPAWLALGEDELKRFLDQIETIT